MNFDTNKVHIMEHTEQLKLKRHQVHADIPTSTSFFTETEQITRSSYTPTFSNITRIIARIFNREGKGNINLSDQNEDENKERGNWTGRLDFLLACLGFAVGLGNVWRFPYLCYRNGGGAFLIPYSIMLGLVGLPLFFMELVLGQFSSLGASGIWKISPLFKGLGYTMMLTTGFCSIYYNVLIAYILRYMFASFTTEVPWAHCNNTWNTDKCVETSDNTTSVSNATTTERPVYPAEEYFERGVLDLSDGIENLGGLKWELVLCLLLAWTVVFLCLSKGVKSIGKVVYFTAVFPYVVLCILFIRGITLPGSFEGIKFYIIPDWSKLQNAKVWGDAAVQIFYSLGPGWGGLIVMSSYNKFHNNCYRDALIVAIANCATSVFAGFVIFSMVGFMAHELNVPVHNVTSSGPGLAFIAYPAGIAMMPWAPFWAIMFFFMLFTIGLDSMFTMIETMITILTDEFTVLRKHKIWVTAGVCAACLVLGLPQCTRGGMYLVNIMDWYSAGFSLLVVSFIEVIVIMHVYGMNRFCDDIINMIGFKPNVYWRFTWTFISPLFVMLIVIFNIWQYTPVYYNTYTYPAWAEWLGWSLVVMELMCIPAVAMYVWWKHVREAGLSIGHYIRFPWTGETLKILTQPSSDWGPALKEHWVYKTGEVATQTHSNLEKV